MKKIKGNVTAPLGFKAKGLWCGLKRSNPDIALIMSDAPASAAGVFTKNSIKAAPLIVSQRHLRNGKARAIVVNSGNANCFTGSFGLVYANQTAEIFSQLLGVNKSDVIVASTGIIGKPLPFEKIKKSAPQLVSKLTTAQKNTVSEAILTTDKKTKESAVEIVLGHKKVTIGACAKGSGMVAPDMATMLCFITTDAAIEPALLKSALSKAIELSFNCITIDGCMSTNDMVVILANGQAQNKTIKAKDKDYALFTAAVTSICEDLAKMIVMDGEGATKLIQINIRGAGTKQQAQKLGLAVANSNLVKTAAFGNNSNWGRVAAAIGSLGIKRINDSNLKISFSPFHKKEIIITVDVQLGDAQAVVYTSDLSYEYVRINVEYN
ncbi:MAG: bifunctional glutamate N-acetyltransferase/amino-acid acetyltransferase ArgJ [Candidatus Omnitrophica bacterium]|nr:bifunctional glutamate N-acetyltransferase/amino-acid acetyltransferase ArgJ [Candidatus Omnitrophota bacterium]